jgi:hypothetical protein
VRSGAAAMVHDAIVQGLNALEMQEEEECRADGRPTLSSLARSLAPVAVPASDVEDELSDLERILATSPGGGDAAVVMPEQS